MPAAARFKDLCTGHGCFVPRPNDEGSPNVFINGRAAHRKGDHWEAHGCAGCLPHDSVLQEGSGTVLINGKQAGRVNDRVMCGSKVQTGSANVFIGG